MLAFARSFCRLSVRVFFYADLPPCPDRRTPPPGLPSPFSHAARRACLLVVPPCPRRAVCVCCVARAGSTGMSPLSFKLGVRPQCASLVGPGCSVIHGGLALPCALTCNSHPPRLVPRTRVPAEMPRRRASHRGGEPSRRVGPRYTTDQGSSQNPSRPSLAVLSHAGLLALVLVGGQAPPSADLVI